MASLHSIQRGLWGDEIYKRCPQCKTLKTLDNFSPGNGRYGFNCWCRPCMAADQARRRAKNPERTKEIQRAHRRREMERDPAGVREKRRLLKMFSTFGITAEEFLRLRDIQQNLCAICGQPPRNARRGGKPVLDVDHCHKTGIVRGLLCHHCNVGLGNFRDNVEFLRTAIAYLEKYQTSAGSKPT